ncbi:hypothetical protein QVD17_02441 [Tagetes erecta]|uniref:K Homology domain-containing protein n=1 Tax=Tagetes erecta TaxID=13708 RepID=A0AAD8L9E0_TARER|nr:hypothetical protein QVD17_02441 [Tagetes erecta]
MSLEALEKTQDTVYFTHILLQTLTETLATRIYPSAMADEEVMGSVSPAPSDHKRKLDDLDTETFEQPPVSGDYNGNSQSLADGDVDGDTTVDDPDAKRPRVDDNSDEFDATDNGHQEEKTEEPKENISEPTDVIKTAELEEDQEKVNESLDAEQKASITDEPLDAMNNESVTDETVNKESVTDEMVNKESVTAEPVNRDLLTEESHEKAVELNTDDNLEGSAKVEHQGSGLEQQDPTPDVDPQDDVFGYKEQSTFDDQPTSRRMEIPSNKVGVLIGKSGDTIRTLQYSSGARIQITRDSEADPNAATRPVQLIGSIESINKAERLIKEVIAEADAGGSPSLIARGFSVHSSGIGEQLHLQVPNEKVGVIIGKGGETIKNLQTRSGARIQLIPQHLPEGDQSKERTVRVTGDRRQIEMAKEMIKEVMDQPMRSSNSSGGYNQQNFRPRGSGGSQWGPRGGHPSQSSGYNNYPPRGGYSSQNPPYSSQGYGNYPSQQPPPRNNYGWDQRQPANKQGPPDQSGYDYYAGPGGPMTAPPSQPPPMHSHAPGPAMGPPPYNYGPPQGPDYGQQPASYPQTAPQGYGQGYGEPRYDHQGPGQHSYAQGTQPPAYPQGGPGTHPGYGPPDQYGKSAYNMPPQQGPYGQPYGQPPRQPYPASSGSMQQGGYPQYGAASVNDGYSGAAPGGYGPQGGPPVSGYGQAGGQQQAPGYGPAAPPGGYGQYPSTQPGYNEQAPPNSAGYGYQGAADPAYGGGPGMAPYGAPPPVQPAYSQTAPAPAPASAPVQPGYDQSVQQPGGYVAPQPQPQAQPQPGYGQYDSNQMYAGHR